MQLIVGGGGGEGHRHRGAVHSAARLEPPFPAATTAQPSPSPPSPPSPPSACGQPSFLPPPAGFPYSGCQACQSTPYTFSFTSITPSKTGDLVCGVIQTQACNPTDLCCRANLSKIVLHASECRSVLWHTPPGVVSGAARLGMYRYFNYRYYRRYLGSLSQ